MACAHIATTSHARTLKLIVVIEAVAYQLSFSTSSFMFSRAVLHKPMTPVICTNTL